MKKFIYLAMICLFLTLWGCSDSSNGVDPIKDFREFSVELRDLIHDELTKAGIQLDALPDGDPRKDAYLTVIEDLGFQSLYSLLIINKVINLDLVSRSGNVFSNEDRDITVTVSADGLYRMDGEFYVGQYGSWILHHASFTWNPATNRWLIIDARLNVSIDNDNEPVPFLRQEGEWNDSNHIYIATTLHIDGSGSRRVGNALIIYGESEDTFQMTCEREVCESNCVDINSTDFYDQGIVTMELTEWDDFKRYSVEDGIPDYEMPATIVEVR